MTPPQTSISMSTRSSLLDVTMTPSSNRATRPWIMCRHPIRTSIVAANTTQPAQPCDDRVYEEVSVSCSCAMATPKDSDGEPTLGPPPQPSNDARHPAHGGARLPLE